MLEDIGIEIRRAIRGLLRSPALTITATLSIALGIAGTATIASLANALFFRPPAVLRPDELLHIYGSLRGTGYMNLSYPEFHDIQERVDAFQRTAAVSLVAFGLRRGTEEPHPVRGELISGDYFGTLGLRPQLGRLLRPDDDAPSAPLVAVISDALWRRRFSADPAVVGTVARLNGAQVTIVGVLPASFQGMFTGLALDIWVPSSAGATLIPLAPALTDRTSRTFEVVARLRPGFTPMRAQVALRALSLQLRAAFPQEEAERGFTLTTVTGVRPELRRILNTFVILLSAAALLVLVTASANVAGLLLLRATARRREVAVRLALGAGRSRVVRQFLTEGVLLALAGGAAGLLLTLAATRALAAFRPDQALPISFNLQPDLRVVGVTFLIAVVTGMLCGLLPAAQATNPDLASALKDGGTQGGTRRARLRSALVTAQIALTVLLLAGAGVLLQSLRRAIGSDPGFDPSPVAIITADPEIVAYSAMKTRAYYDELLRRTIRRPGVKGAAFAAFVPLSSSGDALPMSPDGPGGGTEDGMTGQLPPPVLYNVVTPGYFATLGTPLLRGRDFQATDDSLAPAVVVINESAARRYWSHQDAVGQRLRVLDEGSGSATRPAPPRAVQVIGVVRNAKYRSYSDDVPPYVFFPFAQRYRPTLTLHIRTASDLWQMCRAVARDAHARMRMRSTQTSQ
ncbi:MAG: ABC transporter permease [Gemmatimonadaceae bacterium]